MLFESLREGPRKPRTLVLGIGLLVSLFTLGACSQGVPKEEVQKKDQEIASLKSQIAATEKVSTYWTQLTSLLQPVTMPSMKDHRATMLPSGAIVALHFDNLDLDKAKNLNWVAIGLPGKFCKADQERVSKTLGPGVTHFHDMMNDTHGGKPGADGVWFVHVAVREFEAPWGHVKPGVDEKFMPTGAPVC